MVRPRALLTTRACWWAVGQLRREHASVLGLARQLGISWRTLWKAIVPLLQQVADDDSRFVGVRCLGVDEHGLGSVVKLAPESGGTFTKDPRVGPWNSVLRTDGSFAAAYAAADAARNRVTVAVRLMFDRDTVPGAEPDDLLTLDVPALIVSGQDESHAPSAALCLQECLPLGQYWDVPVAKQTGQTVPAGILEFLDSVESGTGPADRQPGHDPRVLHHADAPGMAAMNPTRHRDSARGVAAPARYRTAETVMDLANG